MAAPAGVAVWPQGDGDLGERLERILARALTSSPWAIALGADSPGLPATHVRAAIEALQTHEAVIGPARDGGYYLLGLTRVRRDLLAGVAWSTPRARADTALRLIERGYRTATLRSWFDVDELHDLDRVRALLRRGVVRAEATARVLGA